MHWEHQWSSEATVVSGDREENWDKPMRYFVYVGFEHPDPTFLGGMRSALVLPAETTGTFFG